MLQDLDFGRLENEYRIVAPEAEDAVLCFRGADILLQRRGDDSLVLPSYGQWLSGGQNWSSWGTDIFCYVFRLRDRNYFLFLGEAGDWQEDPFAYESVRTLRQLISKDICFAIMTGWHLFNWYRNNCFCGRCATPTVADEKERMLRCPVCGNMIFPRINPAVIVAVTKGDRLLLSKYAGRAYTRYALIAGFTEIGETAEQTVAREVMEEVGLRVKNIRYYGSQPWGVDGNLLMGFYCDVDGDSTVHIDENELSMAQWFAREDIPAKDDGISLTREMIRVFEEGREPR